MIIMIMMIIVIIMIIIINRGYSLLGHMKQYRAKKLCWGEIDLISCSDLLSSVHSKNTIGELAFLNVKCVT